MRKNKEIINEIVIVEGKSDTAKLKSIFEVETFETNGFNLTKKKLSYIKKIAQSKGVILFLDPDRVGESIRKKIMNEIECSFNCFINKSDIKKNSKKIGVAEAEVESIINAFKQIKKFDKKTESISWNQYLDLDLNSKEKRLFLTKKLNISYSNNKQLFKRLNMLNLSYEDVSLILKSYRGLSLTNK